MRRGYLKGLKGYRTAIFSLETVATVVPQLISDLFKSFFIEGPRGHPMPIGYDWGRLMEFQVNLGTVIVNQNFDYLDNIIIQFFKSYGCVVPPHKHHIQFPDEAITKFTLICNSFKGKEWDDIIDEFIDALYDFFSQGTMLNIPVQ